HERDGAGPRQATAEAGRVVGSLAYFFLQVNEKYPASGAGAKSVGRAVSPALFSFPRIVLSVTSMTPTWRMPDESPSVIVRSSVIGFFVSSILKVPRSMTLPAWV